MELLQVIMISFLIIINFGKIEAKEMMNFINQV
jgi:hypothetical protein